MAKITDLEKYLGYEFSSGCYAGEDYLKFQTKYINYLKSLCNKHCLNIKAYKNHYCFSAIIDNGEEYIELIISDVRDSGLNCWYNRIVWRYVDAKGKFISNNMYTTLPQLENVLIKAFNKD